VLNADLQGKCNDTGASQSGCHWRGGGRRRRNGRYR
jgi:hypothetical protein